VFGDQFEELGRDGFQRGMIGVARPVLKIGEEYSAVFGEKSRRKFGWRNPCGLDELEERSEITGRSLSAVVCPLKSGLLVVVAGIKIG